MYKASRYNHHEGVKRGSCNIANCNINKSENEVNIKNKFAQFNIHDHWYQIIYPRTTTYTPQKNGKA